MNEKRAANAASTADREFVHSRVIDAPRERVFKAFGDPAHLARWWGPNGFSSTFHKFDFRPGGTWRFVMHGPDGTVSYGLRRPAETAHRLHPALQAGEGALELRRHCAVAGV